MTLKEKIKSHFNTKKYCQIKRKVGENKFLNSVGYIIDFSKNFIVMQEVNDFRVLGYYIFPISTIVDVRYNNMDKYFNKILIWEKQVDIVKNKYPLNLTNWTTIFKSIKKAGFNVIVECEAPDDDDFIIGPITKITKSAVSIHFISTNGYLFTDPTRVTYDRITVARFDDTYTNVLSKYIRYHKK
jgi:hypothetical protein